MCPPNQGLIHKEMKVAFTYFFIEQLGKIQVGTGDSPSTIPFYEKCGFIRSHSIKDFFTDNYDHPIYEAGTQLIDMIYLQKKI